MSRRVKEPPELMPLGPPDKPTIPTIKSLLFAVVTLTVELVPAEVELAVTADPKFESKGEAVFAPLIETTWPLMPWLLPGALNVTTSLERVPEDMAYQHSISPPLPELTVPLTIQERPAVSEMENVSPVDSVYSQA